MGDQDFPNVRAFLSVGGTRNPTYVPVGVGEMYAAFAVRVSFFPEDTFDGEKMAIVTGRWVFQLGYLLRGKFTNAHNKFKLLKCPPCVVHVYNRNNDMTGQLVYDAFGELVSLSLSRLDTGKTLGFSRALTLSLVMLLEKCTLAPYIAGICNNAPVDHTELRTVILNTR